VKPFSNDLAALFDTRTFVSADLYTFVLPGGGAATLTSADHNLVWNGVTYYSGAPVIERSAISQKTGLQVSSIKVTVYPKSSDTIGGLSWLQSLRRGYFDGASVEIDRAFAPAWGQPLTGIITMLKGRVADAKFGRSKAEIDVNSWTELLSNQMPRRYYQSGCNNVLGDPFCGVNVAAYGEAGTITQVENASVFLTTLPANTNWFAYGYITMATGVCATETRPIISNYLVPPSNTVQLQVPLSQAPSVGDVFIAYPGCDKTLGTCQTKFNNLARFAGFPFIPAPEAAV
jgi:uncharacterized phage protein (TIGR02218 family)